MLDSLDWAADAPWEKSALQNALGLHELHYCGLTRIDIKPDEFLLIVPMMRC